MRAIWLILQIFRSSTKDVEFSTYLGIFNLFSYLRKTSPRKGAEVFSLSRKAGLSSGITGTCWGRFLLHAHGRSVGLQMFFSDKMPVDPVCDGSLARLLVTSNQLPAGSWPAASLPHPAYWAPFWSGENILLCFQVQGFWICSFHTSQAPFMKWASISGIQDQALYC